MSSKSSPQDYQRLLSPVANPVKTVTVVVCARNDQSEVGQSKLNLTLASLAAQDYPADLLKVVVVDDGSPVAIVLPPVRPRQTLLMRVEDKPGLWGKSRAANVGAASAQSDLLFFLDSDMVLERSHVRELVSWCAAGSEVVAFGYKKICDSLESTPENVFAAISQGKHAHLVEGSAHRHVWLEDYVSSTGGLRSAGPDVFRAVTGSTLMLSTSLWESAGGYDLEMVTAEDTELGYRLCQRGALVVPVPRAQAWHVGRTTMELHRETMLEHNSHLLAPRVPLLGHLRSSTTIWKVPTVVIDMYVDEDTAPASLGLVEALLAGKLGVDVKVRLVCALPDGSRYRPTEDQAFAVRALDRRFASDSRVEFGNAPLEDPFPSPYYMVVPGSIPLSGLRRMLDALRDRQVGVVCLALPDNYPYPCSAWRTAALGRVGISSAQVAVPGNEIRDLVAKVAPVWGFWWMDPPSVGIHPGRVTYQADPVLTRPGGGPAIAYAKSAWSAWSQTSFKPSSAVAIGSGLARGVSRRARRKAKAQLQKAASKL